MELELYNASSPAQERLARDRRQAQLATEALQHKPRQNLRYISAEIN